MRSAREDLHTKIDRSNTEFDRFKNSPSLNGLLQSLSVFIFFSVFFTVVRKPNHIKAGQKICINVPQCHR